MNKTIKTIIIVLQGIMGLSGIVGGTLFTIFHGLGKEVQDLNGHFDSYLIPMIAVIVIIGFGNLIAVASHWRNNPSSLIISSILGFGVLIFGITKAYVFAEFGVLEVSLIAYGIVVLALNILLAQLRLSGNK
jgi:hypothetical protein